MKVDSHNTEFGYELIATLPYAYWLREQGLLEGTRSGIGSEALYWFSPHHEINPEPRDFSNTAAAAKEIPNMWIHKPRLDTGKWLPPPLKEHFLPRAIRFDKPTVVVCNRYNVEWGRPPVNFFDLDTLRALFNKLIPSYTVVYVNVRGREELEDNAHSMDLGDYGMIASEFPDVRVIHDLVDEHGGDFNDVQCRVFAGCERFITMNGGHAILCSYFGGENIIYTRECREIKPVTNSFYNWYPDLGGSHIRVVNAYDDLLDTVDSAWVRKDPLLNILVRCHERPKGLARLLGSIASQDYRNVRVIASYDNEATWKYLHKIPVEKVHCSPVGRPPKGPSGDDYKAFLPANEYLNHLGSRVQSGYVMYMDDDDLYAPGAVRLIASKVEEVRVLLWRAVGRGGSVIPSDANWRTVTAGDISGIAFAFHCTHLQDAVWEPWRRGDYRVIRGLASKLKTKWLDEPLSIMGERLDEKAVKRTTAQAKELLQGKAARLNALVAQRRVDAEHKKDRPVEEVLPAWQLAREQRGITIRRYRPR